METRPLWFVYRMKLSQVREIEGYLKMFNLTAPESKTNTKAYYKEGKIPTHLLPKTWRKNNE